MDDYFYERTLYTKEEYEPIYENRCSDYFKQDPEEYAKFEAEIKTAIANGAARYEMEERTAQLSNALELAEAANWEKTDFLSRMSRDICMPRIG